MSTSTNLPSLQANKPLEPLTTVDAIVRVSRRNGRQGDDFMSPDVQRKMIQDWCDAHGIVIRNWWDETDSVSGKTTDRVGLKGAMKACLDGKSNGIVVAKVDRFSRNLPEGLAAVYKLRAAGKSFIAVGDGIQGDTARGTGKILLTFLFMMAEWQLESLTDGWDITRQRHIEAGVAGRVPYGYERTSKDEGRKLIVCEDEARWVRHIFDERAKGTGWVRIARDLNDEKVPAPNGGQWVHSAVIRLVANRAYLGELHSGEYVNLTAHDPIVDAKVWVRANRPCKTTAKNPGKPGQLGAGLVRCGSCGGRMRFKVNTVKGATYSYYECRVKFSWGTCAAPARCWAGPLHQMMLDQFALDFGDLAIESVAPAVDDFALQMAHTELADAIEELNEFMCRPLVKMRREHGAETVERWIAEREQAKAEAEAAVLALKNNAWGVSIDPSVRAAWPVMDTEDRRQVLVDVYGAVIVWPGTDHSVIDDRVAFLRPDEVKDLALPGKGVADSAITPLEMAA